MAAFLQHPDEVLGDLGRLISALGEYRAVAVLTGGFVPLMYRSVPGYLSPPTPPLLTSDFDWTVPIRLELLGGRSLADRLTDSGFVAIQSAGTEPPVLRFQPERFGSGRLGPVYAEFLAPLVGSEVSRAGSSKDVVSVQDGLTAQALRYLDLLFVEPVSFDVSAVPGLGLGRSTSILLPNPGSYVFQKLLAWPSREQDKRSKDLAYVYEVAVLTQKHWRDVAAVVGRLKGQFPSPWFDRARELVLRKFESQYSDGPVAVVRQYQDIPVGAPTEGAVWRTVRSFAEATGLA